MGKTRAEIQKDYRERKKKNDPNYLKKESKRQSGYRIPASELSKSALKKRHEKNKQYCQTYRDKKKKLAEKATSSSFQSHEISSSNDSQPQSLRSNESPLLVQFSFTKRNTTKKRSKALRSVNKTIKDIHAKNVSLQNIMRDSLTRHQHNQLPLLLDPVISQT